MCIRQVCIQSTVYTHECLNGKMFNLISDWSHMICIPTSVLNRFIDFYRTHKSMYTPERCRCCVIWVIAPNNRKYNFYFIAYIYCLFYVRHFIIVLLPVCVYNNIIQKVVAVNNVQKSNFPSCLIRNVVFGFWGHKKEKK